MNRVKANHTWDPVGCCFRYPSGYISVTEQEMYSSIEEMGYWGMIGFVSALMWWRSEDYAAQGQQK